MPETREYSVLSIVVLGVVIAVVLTVGPTVLHLFQSLAATFAAVAP